jgi:cell division protein FtsZ
MTQSRKLAGPKPAITVVGVGGGGGNAVANMLAQNLAGVDFLVVNTDAQVLASSASPRIVQLGLNLTECLGAGSMPDVGRAAAEESIDEIMGICTAAICASSRRAWVEGQEPAQRPS